MKLEDEALSQKRNIFLVFSEERHKRPHFFVAFDSSLMVKLVVDTLLLVRTYMYLLSLLPLLHCAIISSNFYLKMLHCILISNLK